jgi:hypothetical protein
MGLIIIGYKSVELSEKDMGQNEDLREHVGNPLKI